jgi:hypothetical protein
MPKSSIAGAATNHNQNVALMGGGRCSSHFGLPPWTERGKMAFRIQAGGAA